MTQRVTKPIALDETFRTTDGTPKNLADVLAEKLGDIVDALGGGGGQSLSASLPLKIEGGTITNNGTGITCTGENAWAEGHNTTASGEHSHAEGSETIASGANTHAEGAATKATHPHAHAEGFHTEATATSAHAEGSGAKATTTTAHAEGQDTVASGDASHAQGRNSVASGAYSHASGYGTRATGQGSHAVGKYNDDGSALFVVGDGTDNNHRKDVFKVDSNGDTWVMIGGVLTKATNVSGGGGGDQFVLVRSDMTTAFTNEEYQDCVNAVTNGKAVCVQFGRNDRIFQAQLTQVEPDTGLLVFEVDVAHIHITYEVSGTNNSHTITESDYQNGTVIFDTLQDAITWNVVLHNGDIFETNGFHTSGDGGAARYKVSSTGTANGMDIVQLSAGKLAVLQVENGEIYPEQLGAVCDDNSQDLTGIFNRAQTMTAVKTIRLHAKRYWFNGVFTITKTNLSIIGSCEYSDSSDYTELTTRRVGDFFIEVEAPNVSIENLSLANRSNGGSVWNGDNVRLYGGIGIASRSWSADASHYNLKFKKLRLISFRTGIELGGKVKWQVTFDNIRTQQCYMGIDLVETAFAVEFDLLHTDRCSYCGLRIFGDTNAILNNCNLGSVKSAVRVENWYHVGEPNPYHNTQLTFNSCNFEVDYQSIANCSGMYVYTEDTIDCILSFNGCRFTQNQATGTVTNNCFSFGNNTVAKFEDCELRRNHSSYNPSLFFDSARPTKQVVGSLIITGNNVDIPSPSYSDVYKPVLMRDDSEGNGLINFNANTNFIDNYGNARKGKLLFNTDTNTLYTYINGVLCEIDHDPGGSDNYVMIGGESYPVVTINGLKWIAANLNLQTTNSVLLTGHESDFRQYYPDGDFSEITAVLPSGWRIPTRADWQQLQPESPSVTDSGWAYWSTLYPAELPNATNTTGFSATPSRAYDSADHDRVLYWTSTVSGTSHVAYGLLKDNGYGYGGMDGKKLCIRVCCDA